MFEKIIYVVNRLDGDYAYLKCLEEDTISKSVDVSAEEKCVARALLPAEIEEGTRLAYEMLEYSIV